MARSCQALPQTGHCPRSVAKISMRSIGQIVSKCQVRIVVSGGSGALGGEPRGKVHETTLFR